MVTLQTRVLSVACIIKSKCSGGMWTVRVDICVILGQLRSNWLPTRWSNTPIDPSCSIQCSWDLKVFNQRSCDLTEELEIDWGTAIEGAGEWQLNPLSIKPQISLECKGSSDWDHHTFYIPLAAALPDLWLMYGKKTSNVCSIIFFSTYLA